MNYRFHAFQPTEPEAPANYRRPDEVVSDPQLTRAEKKAVLASWISDARAVENAPALRRLDSGAVVAVDPILRALVSLDEQSPEPRDGRKPAGVSPPRRRPLPRWLSRFGPPNGSNDNDDDPPPAPAGLAVPFRPNFVAAHRALPERQLAWATG